MKLRNKTPARNPPLARITSERPEEGATVVVVVVAIVVVTISFAEKEKISSKKPIKSPIARIPRFSKISEFQIF